MSLFRITCLYTLHSRPESLESNTVRNLKGISITDQKPMLSLEIQHEIQWPSILLWVQSTSSFLPFLVNSNYNALQVLIKSNSSFIVPHQVHFHFLSSPLSAALDLFPLWLDILKNLEKLQRNLYQWFFCFFYSDMMRWKTSHAFLNSLFPSIYLDRIPAFDVAV